MEPPQLAWVVPLAAIWPPRALSAKPLSELQVMLKLPPPVLEKLLRIPLTSNAVVRDEVSGPKFRVWPAPTVCKPVVADELSKGLAAVRMPLKAPSELPKNSAVVPVTWAVADCAAELVNDSSVELEPVKFSATPVNVPKALSNRPNTPVWLIWVVCNELLKLKFTMFALALNARAVPTTKAASDFMAFPSFLLERGMA